MNLKSLNQKIPQVLKYATSFNKLGLKQKIQINGNCYEKEPLCPPRFITDISILKTIISAPPIVKQELSAIEKSLRRYEKSANLKSMISNIFYRLRRIPSKSPSANSTFFLDYGDGRPFHRGRSRFYIDFSTMRVRLFPGRNAPPCGYWDPKIPPACANFNLGAMLAKDFYGVAVDSNTYVLHGFDDEITGYISTCNVNGCIRYYRGKTIEEAKGKMISESL